jgi:hypothetical protein
MSEREPFGPTPECLTIEALSSAELDGAARRHVESCAHCRNELALLRTFMDAEPNLEEKASVDWIAAEARRRIVAQTASRGREKSLWERLTAWIPSGTPGWVPAGAMACLVLLLGSGVYLLRHDRAIGAPQAGEDLWRSATVSVIRPIGDVVAAPADLAWQAVPKASKYHVRLLEVDRREIWSADTPGTQIAIPPEIAAQLQPGRTLLWQVVANGAAGPLAESNLQTFHISINSR